MQWTKGNRTNRETRAADLGPAVEVEQAMGAGQLATHQPLALHHAARLPPMQVVDGRHHHHVCTAGGGEKRRQRKQNEDGSLVGGSD